MKLQDYEVTIPEGQETADGYVAMRHNTQYRIKLANHGSRLADAEVFIDGQRVGEWRIKSFSSAEIERPVHDTGRFTFYMEGTPEAIAAAIKQSSELGLIKVIFKPEEKLWELASQPADIRRGGTGLSGESKQEFSTVDALKTNKNEHLTIYLRLGASKMDARPLTLRATPIPPPL